MELDELEEAARRGVWQAWLSPPDRVLESWYAALLDGRHTRDVHRGQLLVLTPARPELIDIDPETPCRAYSDEGEFLAILRYRGAGRWHPEKVFSAL